MQTSAPVTISEPSAQAGNVPLMEFAHDLAQKHSLGVSHLKVSDLLKDLEGWQESLQHAYAIFKAAPAGAKSAGLSGGPLARAGEWMLDNFYIAKQAFRQIEEDLPSNFLKQLPILVEGPLAGNSRIFALAWAWIGYNQSQLDLSEAAVFAQYYQQVKPLTIGELWALPIMLRIGILERLLMAVAELTGMESPPGLAALPDQPARLANEIIVANCFLSLRLLSATDWKVFFEQVSLVEQVLRTDPAKVYASMDFETRNSYRAVVEELARHSSFSEDDVAKAAIEFSQRAQAEPSDRKTHVGYYLRDAGRGTLEHHLGYLPNLNVRFRRALLAKPTATYLGSIATFTALFLFGLLAYASYSGGSPAQLFLTGLLGFGLALEAAVTLVHWNVTHRIRPQSLPRMDFSEGIPAGNRTMVVVPTLLENEDELNHLLQELELYYLSNPDPQLTYALLTDFGDAPTETMPGDEALLALASAGIANLNQKYLRAAPFYLFHRQRQWNPSEGAWMGWERKRGKLADFNRLLLNLGETSYSTQVGRVTFIPGSPAFREDSIIKYVITLDADTSLPQGSANRLIATLAHPLNRAEFASDGRSVIAGYTVLQPRVAIKPTSANRSLFSQIFAGNPGFDLYSFAVSDVYQDMFGEGSYVGKGIYDVAAFERCLAGQVRQNTLLSHDLFEGIYGRAALVTDIVLYEEYPSRYLVYSRRLKRWIRGDWQLLPWLFPMVNTQAGMKPNRLSTINLWKIFDNLRRSLLPPMLLALISAGWLVLPGSPLVWTVLVLLPSALPLALQIFPRAIPRGKTLGRLSLKQQFGPARLPLLRWALVIVFLPHEALLMLGAIRTTLVRLLIQRRKLLQWTTAANSARAFGLKTQYETWLEMAGAQVFTLALGAAIIIIRPAALWIALPVLVSWLAAPQIANIISRTVTHTTAPLPEPQRRQVQRLARRTWAFFEQFAGPNDHWLPPDHFQEAPLGSVSHYTTPTNIGLFMVSTLSAYDLGYLGLSELELRLRSTFDSIESLEHYRGHLLNWYDSQTMEALPPRYISTVDSGNLAACLITLKQGCLALADAPLLGSKQWQGLLVILDILTETLHGLEKNNPAALTESIEVELISIYERVSADQSQPEAWAGTLAWLLGEGWEKVTQRLMEMLENQADLQAGLLAQLQLYLNLMHQQLLDMQRSLALFAPWLSLPGLPSDGGPQKPGWNKAGSGQAWQEFCRSLPQELPSLGDASASYERIESALNVFITQADAAELDWCASLGADLSAARAAVTALMAGFYALAARSEAAVTGMDFRFLFNERRQVFHIGYNTGAERLDPSFYDLLASEARIASLVAIAKGDVPQSHWQHLGRPVTIVNGKQVLLSWSGTMFEYLMPTLFVRNYAGTFLSESCYAALDAQIEYGESAGLEWHEQPLSAPWGISESGYYAFDVNLNYQYRAFGAPALGYKRDLPDDLVITPYASLLGLSLQPQAVLENMAHLEELNMLGRFGFYEALDYTRSRLPAGETNAMVKSYMAHHQGMILLAACNYLLDDVMVRRFHSNEHIRSVELLLQEKIPQNPPIEYPHSDKPLEAAEAEIRVSNQPWMVPVDGPIPQAHLLAQGETSLMITSAGGGYSQWREFALTRWHADSSLDQWGAWIYVQDREDGALWSTFNQPSAASGIDRTSAPPSFQQVMFYPHKVEFQRTDNGISLRTGVTISMDGVEIRRVNILNDSNRPRHLRLASYAEVVLAEQAADRRHPAFNKLFIESEYLAGENALLFERRPRSSDDKPVVLLHALLIEAGRKVTGDYESDRAQFLGRLQTVCAPLALMDGRSQLSRTTGGTLDPIFSLAQDIDLKPHAKTRITFLTLAAPTRAEALEKLSHYKTGQAVHLAFDDARARTDRRLLETDLNSYAIENIQRLYSALIYPTGLLRAAPHILAQNEKSQPDLWSFGISGDYPILLLRIRDGDSPLLLEALQAFGFWRERQATINLVILNDQDTGYALDLHNTILRQVRRMGAEAWLNQRNGIFLLRTDQLQPQEKILLETVAGVILDEKNGSLADHAARLTAQPTRLPGFSASLSQPYDPEPTPPLQFPTNLLMENGLGGFSPDGREYIIHLRPGQHTPSPWVNVIANSNFGFLVSEAGSGCTWAGNSGENRLSPWRNDPVSDIPGEALYLRDEETGLVWSPTPLPAGADNAHMIRHGAGYSIFESQSHGFRQTLRLFTAPDAPVKIAHLRLQNLWKRPRRITVTYYLEWVLGTTRDVTQAHILPEFDPVRHALLARNPYNSDFKASVAFLAANKKPHGVTADRGEFLGRMGSMRTPAALGRIGLESAVNAGLDPCGAIQLHIDLAPDADEEVFFLIGEGADRAESLALIEQMQSQGQIEAAWQGVGKKWDEILDAVSVQTPDPAMDLMLNRWLLYQTLSCRLWGRTALYQSSGAFGFRDQLQDVLALMHSRPEIARAQIVEAARHQFEAGDVLHWWNPPAGRGVRTRFSDDLLWLPFVTAGYVEATGDLAVLNEMIPYLKGEPLRADELERYTQFEAATESFSLFDHCRRAIAKGSTVGAHGLPLMGAGDWNDGMNRVGIQGRGESIWLGWFLCATLERFASMTDLMGQDSGLYRLQAGQLSGALETHTWDGEWYLRAFFDDGTTLGSHENLECQIDSIAQSWAVLSHAADPLRAARAMQAVSRLLVKPAEQMVLLFTPPFDKSPHDPGYIKGYLPGVRENGGQYTHAAIWTAWAFAALGQGDKAAELFHFLNPISHTDTPTKAALYKAEPYVIAADIYSMAPHIGRAGWTWYTGSSGWMYRLGIEAILGISKVGDALKINPCIPTNWPGYKVDYRFGKSLYRISVENPDNVSRGVVTIFLNGSPLRKGLIPLLDDGLPHDVRVVMG